MEQQITNRGSGYDVPDSVTDANGTAVVTMPELAAAMEGDDGSGKGYDELAFTVSSSGTAGENGDGGYEILACGFPEGLVLLRLWPPLHRGRTRLLSPDRPHAMCIARAVAVHPQVLLMDEPCSALDPISTLAVEDLINE